MLRRFILITTTISLAPFARLHETHKFINFSCHRSNQIISFRFFPMRDVYEASYHSHARFLPSPPFSVSRHLYLGPFIAGCTVQVRQQWGWEMWEKSRFMNRKLKFALFPGICRIHDNLDLHVDSIRQCITRVRAKKEPKSCQLNFSRIID